MLSELMLTQTCNGWANQHSEAEGSATGQALAQKKAGGLDRSFFHLQLQGT